MQQENEPKITWELAEYLREEIEHYENKALHAAKQCGDVLRKLKERVDLENPGTWMASVRENFPKGRSSDGDYRLISERWDDIPNHVKDKGSISGALKCLRKKRTSKLKLDAQPCSEKLDAVNSLWNDLPDSDAPKWYGTVLSKNSKTREIIKRNEMPHSIFLDSGAYGLQKDAAAYAEKYDCPQQAFYDTAEFEEYLEEYVWFVKTYGNFIDHHANVDVIGDPKLSHRNLAYLEASGLKPVPVVHFGSDPDLRWLDFYIDRHEIVGLGGLVKHANSKECKDWITRCFEMVCNTADKKPMTLIHGFGTTSPNIMLKHSFHSVDSSTWLQFSSINKILVPYRNAKADDPPHRAVEVTGSPKKNDKKDVAQWLNHLGITWEQLRDGDEEKRNYRYRRVANVKYFEEFRKSHPTCPLIYYSGNPELESTPEVILEDDANVMLSFYDLYKQKRLNERLDHLFRDRSQKTKGDQINYAKSYSTTLKEP